MHTGPPSLLRLVQMIEVGFTTVDPTTGTRSTLIEGEAETDGMGWTLEVQCPVGAAPHILEHVHLSWTETFIVLQGNARYKLNGSKHTASEGDRITMPPGQPHMHPWNAGDTEMIYRQVNEFAKPSPEAVQDVIGVFATINGLKREGKINKRGLPKNPLQFAATLRTLVKHDGFDAKVPISLQRFIASTVGRAAEAMGYRGAYPRYLQETSHNA